MPITYPIQDSDRFTIFDTLTQKPLTDSQGKACTGQIWGSSDKSKMIEGLEPNVKWLLEIIAVRPTFDSATQRLKRLPAIYNVDDETATLKSYEVVDLTAEEIEARIPPHFATSQGIKLDVTLEAQNAFTRMMTLIEQAQMPDAQEVKVQDVYKATHTLTVAEFKTEMVSYGLYCYELFHAVDETTDTDFV